MITFLLFMKQNCGPKSRLTSRSQKGERVKDFVSSVQKDFDRKVRKKRLSKNVQITFRHY
jgi:hypothetical protein